MQQTSMQVFDRLFLDDGTGGVATNTMISDTMRVQGNQVGLAFSVIAVSGTFTTNFPAVNLLGSQNGRTWITVAAAAIIDLST